MHKVGGAQAARGVAGMMQGGERDPQRFWLSVLGALRRTSAGSALVRAVTAAPDLDGWAIVERLRRRARRRSPRITTRVRNRGALAPGLMRIG
jgi:hypothetical protein